MLCAFMLEIDPGLLETVYEALLAHLKLTGKKRAYLLNFGDELMKDGIFRILNGHVE